jgi:hypothetical protein
MSRNLTRAELLDSLKNRAGIVIEKDTKQWAKDSKNCIDQIPLTKSPAAPVTKEQALAGAAAANAVHAKRIEDEEAAKQKAADESKENPFAAMLQSGNVTFSREQRKRLEALAKERAADNDAKRVATEAHEQAVANPAYVQAVNDFDGFVRVLPSDELRQEARNAIETLKRMPTETAAYQEAQQRLFAAGHAHIDARLAELRGIKHGTDSELIGLENKQAQIPEVTNNA